VSPDFATGRAELARTRAARVEAESAAALAAERRRAIAAAHGRLARSVAPDDPTAVEERNRFDELAKQAQAELGAAKAGAQQAKEAERAALESFAAFTDPRVNAVRLSDRSPFVLFPVRLETRFADRGTNGGARPQLLVRIYPDECSVDTFEPTLSATELTNAKRYWEDVWRAGGGESDERAAWRRIATAHGSGRAGWLVDTYRPSNLVDGAPAGEHPVFPPDPPTTASSWSQAPRVKEFPERFVVLGFADGAQVLEAVGGVITLPLYVGPDPSADPSETIHPDGSDLFVPNELRWLVDFDRAVEAGMGLAIDLTPEQAQNGFDRLLVLGLQLASGDAEGKAALEELLLHHAVGRSGLAVVPQGTPTNNTTGNGSGYTRVDDPDRSFDDRRDAPLFFLTDDPFQKRDGQWLAELLGIDPALLTTVHGSGGADQLQARAMQRALWPATLGYWLDKLLAPVFDDAAVARARSFFTRFVSGRGPVPAIRIGTQPYGVLPTTAFSRIRWLGGGEADGEGRFLARLLAVLRLIRDDWAALSREAAHVGKPGDPQRTLLDIVGLHPSSVEFHYRYAESLRQLYNVANLSGSGPAFWQAVVANRLEDPGGELLARLGYTGPARPDLLRHVFLRDAGLLANVIDDRPLSETDPVRAYTGDGRNYIDWLVEAASTSLDAMLAEDGFAGDVTPAAVLYLFLRHAVMLGYADASYGLHKRAGVFSAEELAALKPEPLFVHVAEGGGSESRLATLYKSDARISADPDLPVGDFITRNLGSLEETGGLADQIEALRVLAGASTAQLERAFAEHVDVCSHRFDAWLLGLVNLQLQAMRYRKQDDGEDVAPGAYLGGYAWLEDLRPSPARPAPVELAPELAEVFGGPAPLVADPANGGYVHAPSLPHAKTAAVLRSGYLANASTANPDSMAVNLSSRRVRLALSLLEGIRGGQSLGALLGYRFERGLHDRHGLAEVDKFIYPLRKVFPLAADALAPTKTDPDVPIEAIEARNVLDGRKLVARLRSTGGGYPFGLDMLPDALDTLPKATDAERAAIDAEAEALLELYDAVSDLALAEGVHQAVQGNFERVTATLDAYTTGNFPPEPEVVQTPLSGKGLTHRVAVHLRPGLAAPPDATPRARAEPAVDAWLADILPSLDEVGCTVVWSDPVGGAEQQLPVTLADLGVRPIDVLELVNSDQVQELRELDDRILRFVVTTIGPRPDSAPEIRYMTAPPGGRSLFELAPLVRSLRRLVTKSRPLRATDALLQRDASPGVDAAVFVARNRIAGPAGALDTLATDVDAFLAILEPLLADRVAVAARIDEFLDGAVDLLARAAAFNLPLSGWGFAYAWRRSAFADLLAQVREGVGVWDGKLEDLGARLTAYDALPDETGSDERFRALRGAETLLSTALDPLPPDPGSLREALDGKRDAFVTRRDRLAAVLETADPSFGSAVAAVRALGPFDLAAFEERAVACAEDLAANLAAHRAEIEARRGAVRRELDAHDAATEQSGKADALQAGARALFGDEFRIVPEFELSPAQGNEWANAVAASSGGALLDYVRRTAGVDFPVDEWLYGAARVRPMLHAWEATVLLAGAFERPEPVLLPIQLPFEADAPWLALEFPPDYVLDGERLLYTAQYSTPFDRTARQSGLLLDEWNEVIPAPDRTTGLAFNFNRPDNEAPQAILLVTPATANGAWQWDDLVGALNETLDLAKVRAVEPAHVDGTAYARFLPATVMASTAYGISIATNLAAANEALEALPDA